MFMIFEEYKKNVKGNIFCFLTKKTFTGFFCMSKFAYLKILSIICNLLICNLVIYNLGFAQQTNNLQVIWQKTSPDSVLYFGRCIGSGDVNGDGYSDVMIVGDSVIDLMGTNPYRGKCWIYLGGPNFDTIPDLQLLNNQEKLFVSLHASDINGDGFDDVMCGANNNQPSSQVLIFLGGNPTDSTCDFILRGNYGSGLGCAVSSGDVNNDGYIDLIVGAAGEYLLPVGEMAGRVYIYFGGPNFDTIPDVILNGGHNNNAECFGCSVSGSGDVNNDGFDDVIIGANNFNWDRGRIYIYLGGNPMDTNYDVAMMGEGAGHSIGEFGVDLIGNQQTYDYAITGTSLLGGGRGKVYVLFGGNPMDSVPDICMVGRTSSSRLGQSLSRAGFVSGLLSEGIIAGAPIEYSQKGTAYFWQGGVSIDSVPEAWISGVIQYDGIGWHVASAGDVDGDGRDEIMICNSASPIEPSRKKVWVCKYTGVGIEEKRLTLNARRLMLEVCPNPVKSVLRVRCPLSVKEIRIYDISGKVAKEIATLPSVARNDSEAEVKVSLKGIPAGIYFVEVIAEQEEERKREIRKIIVTK